MQLISCVSFFASAAGSASVMIQITWRFKISKKINVKDSQKFNIEENKRKRSRVKLFKTMQYALDVRHDKFSVLTIFQLDRKYDYTTVFK